VLIRALILRIKALFRLKPVTYDWLIFCAFPAIFGLKAESINAGIPDICCYNKRHKDTAFIKMFRFYIKEIRK